MKVKSAGDPSTASSNRSPRMPLSRKTPYSSPKPSTHWSGPQLCRSAATASRTSSSDERSRRSAPRVSSAPWSGWMWLSVSPGTTTAPCRSMVSLAAPSSLISASLPTATISPSTIARAAAAGSSGSSVRTRASTSARSIFVYTVLAAVDGLDVVAVGVEQERRVVEAARPRSCTARARPARRCRDSPPRVPPRGKRPPRRASGATKPMWIGVFGSPGRPRRGSRTGRRARPPRAAGSRAPPAPCGRTPCSPRRRRRSA